MSNSLVPTAELLYAMFSVCDNALSTACAVWLCWQYPTLGRRPWRAVFICGLLLFGTPAVVALGQWLTQMTMTQMAWSLYWLPQLYSWNLLWTVAATPFFLLTMILIRRLSGIAVTKPGIPPPIRPAISIRDLCLWTFVVAVVFAVIGVVSRWMHEAVAAFGAQFSGSAAVGYAVFQAFIFALAIFVLVPNLRTPMWLRVMIGYAIYVAGRGTYVALMSTAGAAALIPHDFWVITMIRGVSAVLGMILGHRFLMARDYRYTR